MNNHRSARWAAKEHGWGPLDIRDHQRDDYVDDETLFEVRPLANVVQVVDGLQQSVWARGRQCNSTRCATCITSLCLVLLVLHPCCLWEEAS